MKKFILVFIFTIFSVFSWQTYDTEAGGVGIYQDCVAGADAGQIAIFKENGGYKLYFVTQKYQLRGVDAGIGGVPKVAISCENDLGKGSDFFISGSCSASNATQFGFKDDKFKEFLLNSKWIKFSFTVPGGMKTFKFDFAGFSKALSKVKE